MESPGDIANVVGELRRELDRLAIEDDGGSEAAGALSLIESCRTITSDRPPLVAPGPLAPIKRAAKRFIQKTLRWYVEPVAADMRRLANGTARFAHIADQRDTEMTHALNDLQVGVAALRDRVIRLERSARTAPPPADAQPMATVPSPLAAEAAPLDYFAFEGDMRGTREAIAERQRDYLEVFADASDVLDIGCGRGEFLGLLREAGKSARGIDLDADMVAHCRAEGFTVTQADAVSYLKDMEAGSVGGIFASQVVEHMRPPVLVGFLAACKRTLEPGGTMVLETINPASLSALRNYFADLTHAQPLVAETLAFLVESAGFRDVRTQMRSPLPPDGRLGHVPYGSSVTTAAQQVADRNVDLLNTLLFAPQDYAIIARA